MSDQPIEKLFSGLAIIAFIVVGFIVASDIVDSRYTPDCSSDEVEVFYWTHSGCIDYNQTLQKVLTGMNRIDRPAYASTISEVTPNVSKKEVEAVLKEHRSRTGKVYNTYDGGAAIETWHMTEEVSNSE